MTQTSFQDMRSELQEKLATFKAEMKKLGEDFFKEQSQNLFTEYPELDSFSWTQYTPYFNDGDECIFSVYSDYPTLVIAGEVHEDAYVPYKVTTGSEPYTETYRLYEAVQNLISAIDDDVMKQLFGDHCRVIVTKTGVEVEDYDHE